MDREFLFVLKNYKNFDHKVLGCPDLQTLRSLIENYSPFYNTIHGVAIWTFLLFFFLVFLPTVLVEWYEKRLRNQRIRLQEKMAQEAPKSGGVQVYAPCIYSTIPPLPDMLPLNDMKGGRLDGGDANQKANLYSYRRQAAFMSPYGSVARTLMEENPYSQFLNEARRNAYPTYGKSPVKGVQPTSLYQTLSRQNTAKQ